MQCTESYLNVFLDGGSFREFDLSNGSDSQQVLEAVRDTMRCASDRGITNRQAN